MATEKFANKPITTLSIGITASSPTFSVADASAFPHQPQFRIKIEDELLIVTGVSGSVFTVIRGAENTVAAAHGLGVTVVHILTAGALDKFESDVLDAVGSGVQGAQGWQGSIGVQGWQGNQGSGGTGAQGWQGNQGSGGTGAQGNQGRQGDSGGGGGGGPTAANRLIAPDSHTILRYTLDEGSTPCLNTGTGGTLNMDVPAVRFFDPFLPTPFTFCRGIFGSGISTLADNAAVDPALITANTIIGESTEVSISIWIKWNGTQTGQVLFGKLYHSATSSSPSLSFGITTDSFGSILAQGTFGSASEVIVNSRQPPIAMPVLISATYSTSTHIRLYINGELINSSDTTSTAIDWGEHGAWLLSGYAWGTPAGTGGGFGGMLDEARFEDVVRSQEYFREMYAQGVGIFL